MTTTDEAAIWLAPQKLKPWKKNPRKNDHAVQEVAESIRRYGFGAPIVARRATMQIIAGHTRWKAAMVLELKEVPVRLLDISEQDAERLALIDNRLAELADWDAGALLELHDDLNLIDLGWSDAELENLRRSVEEPSAPVDQSSRWETVYQIVIDCADETEQLRLVEELEERGVKCRLLIM